VIPGTTQPRQLAWAKAPFNQQWLWHGALLALCLTPSLLVGHEGLHRPYDAIPDQDLLWASEALRLIRGVAPSYADHPGAFWTLIYQLNIQVVQLLSTQPILDSAGSISPEGIVRVIQAARIENAILCGFGGYLVFPISQQALGTRQWLAALLAAVASFSSAILVGVSEIRHEAISTVFLLAMVALFSAAMHQPNLWGRRILIIASVGLYFCAAFSKNQSLLLTPLVFLAIGSLASNDLHNSTSFTGRLRHLDNSTAVRFALLSSLPWLISAYPDIDLINMPFWMIINTGLALTLAIGWSRQPDRGLAFRSLGALGIAEILLFRGLSPQWWRQGVTGFPSWMFRYANAAENEKINVLTHTSQGVHQYFSNLFEPDQLSLVAFGSILAISSFILLRTIITHSPNPSQLQAQALGWIFCGFVLASCSQRIAPRYEIYIFLPILICTGATLNSYFSSASSAKQNKRLLALLLAISSTILLVSSTIQSTINSQHLKAFVNQQQPRDVLCIGHHMDRTMRRTSAGQCEVFPKGAKDKNIYDSWGGPSS